MSVARRQERLASVVAALFPLSPPFTDPPSSVCPQSQLHTHGLTHPSLSACGRGDDERVRSTGREGGGGTVM